MASLAESTCVFAADGDLLGLGVRIGAYLAVCGLAGCRHSHEPCLGWPGLHTVGARAACLPAVFVAAQ